MNSWLIDWLIPQAEGDHVMKNQIIAKSEHKEHKVQLRLISNNNSNNTAAVSL